MVYDAPRKSIFPPGQHSNVAGGISVQRPWRYGWGGRGGEEGDGYPFRERVGGGGPGGTEVFFPRGGYHMLAIAPLTTSTPRPFYTKNRARGCCPRLAGHARTWPVRILRVLRRNIEHGKKSKPKRVRRLLLCRQKNRHVYMSGTGERGGSLESVRAEKGPDAIQVFINARCTRPAFPLTLRVRAGRRLRSLSPAPYLVIPSPARRSH